MSSSLNLTKIIIIEVMFKRPDCPICQYMDEAVLDIMPDYQGSIDYRRVDIADKEGSKRFLELSVSLYGEEGVYKKLRIAPLPSLFINGELFFETIPSRPLLEEALDEVTARELEQLRRVNHGNQDQG